MAKRIVPFVESAKHLAASKKNILKAQAACVTHGSHKTPEYEAWVNMKQRCTNPGYVHFEHYGGRGIVVCEEWFRDFATFLRDVGQRPSSNHSLDRYPNNNGNYEPGNVRWATRSQQHMNKRNNRLYTYKGETKHLFAWAETYKLPVERLRNRIRSGWSIHDALTTPQIPHSQRRNSKKRNHHPPPAPHGQ